MQYSPMMSGVLPCYLDFKFFRPLLDIFINLSFTVQVFNNINNWHVFIFTH